MIDNNRSDTDAVAVPNRKLGMINAEAVWGLLLAVIAAILLVVAYQPREVTIFTQADNMYWPRRILWPLLILCLFITARAVVRELTPSRDGANDSPWVDRRHFVRPALLMAACVLAFFLIDVIGFVPFTFLFTGAVPLLLGPVRLRHAVIFATTVTFVIWVLFLKILIVPLPRGIGLFRELSFFIQ